MTIILEDNVVEVTITAGAAISTPFDMRKYSRMAFLVPADWTNADIGFYNCDSINGVYNPMHLFGGGVVEINVVSGGCWYSCLPRGHTLHFARLWSQNAGVDVPQAADRVIRVCIKT